MQKYSKYGKAGYGPGPKTKKSAEGAPTKYARDTNVVESRAKTFAAKKGGY